MIPTLLVCFGITVGAAGNRLGMFMSHHATLKGSITVNEKFISKSTFSPNEEREFSRQTRMERQSKLESMERICTAKTCSKCAKYVLVKSNNAAFKHCTTILDTPHCCPTQHILLSGF